MRVCVCACVHACNLKLLCCLVMMTLLLVPYEPLPVRYRLSVRVGETVAVSCHAVGLPTPFVRWLKDGNPLVGRNQRITQKSVSTQVQSGPRRGAIELNRTLEIKNVQFSDAAVYQCETRLARNREPTLTETILEVSSKARVHTHTPHTPHTHTTHNDRWTDRQTDRLFKLIMWCMKFSKRRL